MNPRKKVHSSRSVAFSWVRKALPSPHHGNNTGSSGQAAVPQKSSPPPPITANVSDETPPAIHQDMKIPPPPCRSQPPPRRRTFWKAFRRQHDPFLVAYKECTKTPALGDKVGVGFNSIAGKSRVSFSCKTSVDARDDHFLKPSSMPPRLPHPSNPYSFTAHT